MSSLVWNKLTGMNELEKANELSFQKPILLYKHSTRCGISSMALSRLERSFKESNLDYFYLDLLSYRDVSNAIAEKYGVYHQSPQVLLISKGECILEASHMDINLNEIIEEAQNLN